MQGFRRRCSLLKAAPAQVDMAVLVALLCVGYELLEGLVRALLGKVSLNDALLFSIVAFVN